MLLRMLKIIVTFLLAVILLVIMTPWAMLTALMGAIFEGMNKLYAKLVDYMIKNGEGL